MKKTMSLRVSFTIANAFKSPMKGKGQKKAMGGAVIFITGISKCQGYQKIKNKSKGIILYSP